MSYAKHISTKVTPQSLPVFGKSQVKNNAGGYVFKIDCFGQLDRFLILGNEKGSYYSSEQKMTRDNATCVLECAKKDLAKTLERIRVMVKRAPKKTPSIFALALLMSSGYPESKIIVNEICKISTDIFMFNEFCKELRGRGRALNSAVKNWYLEKTPSSLAYQVTKYQQRNGWSHRDLLRLTKPKTSDSNLNDVFKYVCQREKWILEKTQSEVNDFLSAVEEIKVADEKRALAIIDQYGLAWEHLPTQLLNSPEIWYYLLQNMPTTAMVRNLGKMSSIGLLSQFSDGSKLVCEKLKDPRMHPFNILLGLSTYKTGHGLKGSLTWDPNHQVMEALESAFHLSFEKVEPSNKRFYFGIDVSGSMNGSILNTNISARTAAAILALVSIKHEPFTYSAGFTSVMTPITILKSDTTDSVCRKIYMSNFGSTDCAQPMLDALKKNIPIDCFVVLTDSETWYGGIHPFQALEQYRQKTGINSKLIVVGLTATGFSIANPADAGMLDVVGFDSGAPSIISSFCA